MNEKYFNPNSARSLFIEMYFNETYLASATAFMCESKVGDILFTNRHNVTGRHQGSDTPISKTAAIPNRIKVRSLGSSGINEIFVNLYKNFDLLEKNWVEHPVHGEAVDVVGILLNAKPGWNSWYVVPFEDWHRWEIGNRISVVGFPFGESAAGFALWATGYIASEPDVDYNGLPLFLIDCRTRQGQSGSQVIAEFKAGDFVQHQGKMYQAQQAMTHFLGVYSGRINEASDLGMVWKPSVVREIVQEIENS